MSSDRLVNFLFLYNKWSQKYVMKGFLIIIMIDIGLIIALITLVDESENRKDMESIIFLLTQVMVFIIGIAFGIMIIVPAIMNRLQDKV